MVGDLERAIRQAWCAQTSDDAANWNSENPSYGQCAVTACVVQDYLGGEIVNSRFELDGKTVSHYFNLIDGKEIDLTREQFPKGTVIPAGVPKTKEFETTRDYVLSFEPTMLRYELLRDKVAEIIGNGI